MSKKLKIIGGIALVFVLLVGGVILMTSGPATAATAFFESCVSEGFNSAYDKASPGFRATVTRAQFAEFSVANRLGTFKSATWSSRHIEAGEAVVKGTLSLEGGVVRPLTVALVKSSDGIWRVLSVRFDQAGVIGSGGAASPPAQTEQGARMAAPPSTSSAVAVRPWRESWLMVGCEHAVKVVMHFIPDSSGTSAASRPEESVLLR